MSRLAILLITVAALALGRPATAAIFTIDDFSSGTTFLNLTAAAPPTQSATDLENGLSGVVGGSRSTTIEKLNGLSGGTRNVTGAVDAENKEFAYISGNGVTGAMSLGYDANGAGLNVFVNPVLDKFAINFIAGDYSATRTIPVTMTITASNNQVGTLSNTLATEVSPTVLEFSVADFSNLSGMNLGSNALKSIQISFTPTATSADFTLGAIAVVPEPSAYAMALTGLSFGGLLVRRRRKRG